MRNTSLSRFVTGLLILLAVVFVKADLGAEAEKEKLVTSGVKLKPVLIGTQITDKDRKLADEGGKFAGPLNIVIDTPYQIWGEMGTYIHLAIYDPKFNAASEAVVYMDGQAIGKADKTGTFVFSVAPNPDQSYGNNHALAVVYTKPGGKKYSGTVNFNSYPRTQGFESTSIFVYTDRGIYNPGQTIRIRSIAWSLKDDFFPLEDKKLEFLLKNDRGRVVAGGGVETDKWGIAHMEIPLPDNAPEGKYTLEANYDRESASADLRIERFTPPVIEIRHTLGRFLTKDAKELPFDVTLGYFGGGSFKAGKIKISVKAAGRIEYEDEKEVKGKGPHKFMLDKKALKKIRKNLAENEYVQVKIAVEDEYERKDEVKRDMRYTSNPYTVIVEMDKDQYTTGETAHVMVRATDLDMVPIREKEVKLVLEGKKYNEKTDKGGIAKFDIEVPERYLSGEVFLEGVDNPVAYATINWIAPRPMSSEIPQGYVKEKQDTDIVIRFPTDFIPREDVVHVDIVDSSGALISAALVPVKKEKGKWIARGTFPAPAWGSMLLTIFCVGSSGKEPVGLLTDGQNLPVLPNREIRIDLKGAPKKAAPGAKIKIKATVMDAAGKKIDAAVGAAIVDEAVISMLDPLEKTPMDKFYNPQLKVLSTTGSKILTWPVVTRNWGYPLYDIALPPFGFRAGGATSQGSSYGYGGGGGYGYAGDGGGGGDYDYYMDSGADYAPAGNITKSGKKAPKMKMKTKAKAMKKVSVKAAQMKLLDSTMLEGSVGGYDYPAASASAPMPAAPMPSPEPAYEESKVAAGKYELAFSDDAVDGELAYYKVGTEKQKQKPKVSITVRTNFAETSLWEPTLEAKDGNLEVSSVLPDSITTQTITLLASDDKGSVGMARHEIEVAQDIYTRSNFPATLTVGDSVEVFAMVKNLTKNKVSCKVSLASKALNVAGVSERDVTVPAEGVGVAGFVVEPKEAGPAMYEVKAEGAKFTDVERRELFVRPLGVSDRIEAKGYVKKKKAFKAKVKVSGSDMYLFSFLNVSLPTAVPMIQGMEEILSQPGGAIDFVSSKALTTAMVYQYLVKYAKNEEAIERINPFLQQLMAAQLMTQNHDGGWGWHFHLLRAEVDGTTDVVKIKSNPYMTAQTIEALVEMKRAGLPVPEQAIGRAMQFLASAVSSDNLWSVDDIAFWEGKTKQVQEGISAEIFRVMADACEVYPNLLYSWNMQNPMDKISAAFTSYLDMEEMRDPMGLSNAAMGVYTWAKVRGGVGKDLEKKLGAAAKKLIVARKESYWEPSWFNAFGGTIEATTAAMMFMHKLDKDAYESELRRSIQYILSTQESFGAWHNARGTAAAIRALLLVPPTEKEIASTVKVFVNGNLVEKVDIDPDDPYLSAVSLRQVEITKYLTKGENMVEVTYDGNLKAPVSLMLQKWSGKKAYSAVRQTGAPDVTVARSYKGKGNKQGAPIEVKLSLNVKESRGPLVVREPLPSNAQVEGASLDALLEEGKVEGYELDGDDIVFYLAPDKKGLMSLSYRVTPVRNGRAVQPGTTISSVYDPDAFVSGQPTKLIVK